MRCVERAFHHGVYRYVSDEDVNVTAERARIWPSISRPFGGAQNLMDRFNEADVVYTICFSYGASPTGYRYVAGSCLEIVRVRATVD